MWVRLTGRLASCIDGVNLAARQVGDVFAVTPHDAELLIAEEWAVPAAEAGWPLVSPLTSAELLRDGIDQPVGGQEQRRAEDRLREELRDSRATIISKDPV